MRILPRSAATLALLFASGAALATGCGSDGGGGGASGAGGAGTGGSAASGGQAGGAGGAPGGSGGSGGSAGVGGSGTGGTAGSDATAGGSASGGAPPMCSSGADCKEASVSYPNSTEPPATTATTCVGGQCGLVTQYNGAYKTPKPPKSCTEICAASTYQGQPMKCTGSCLMKKVNGFGDQGLAFEVGDAGVGSVSGLVRYQFSPMSGGYKFLEVACGEVPKSKLIQGTNSYTYVSHSCCCVAP